MRCEMLLLARFDIRPTYHTTCVMQAATDTSQQRKAEALKRLKCGGSIP
jgi:hypothetical protein